jgi:hypothetical protein
MVLFGGETALFNPATATNELWFYFFDNSTWEFQNVSRLSEVPPPRLRHTAITTTDTMMIFGGHNNQTTFNDLWLYKFTSGSWKELHSKSAVSPSPRYDHTVVLSGRRITYGMDGVAKHIDGVAWRLRKLRCA